MGRESTWEEMMMKGVRVEDAINGDLDEIP
jgi:hypothetical protein